MSKFLTQNFSLLKNFHKSLILKIFFIWNEICLISIFNDAKGLRMKRFLLSVILGLAGIGNVQAEILTTTFNYTNAQSGNMFDVVTLGAPLIVTALDLNITWGTYEIELYKKAGTWVGSNTNPAAWTLVGNGLVTSAGLNHASFFDVSDFELDANAITGLYVTSTLPSQVFGYTMGTAVGNVAASNSDMQILEGAGIHYAFSDIYTPRIWNGSIEYVKEATIPEPATYSLLALGLVGLIMSRRKTSNT